MSIQPVAIVRSPRTDRRDDHWGSIQSTIVLDEQFALETLAGLEAFSHLEVIFLFHGISESEVEMTSRHPRNNPKWPKVGIFAQRGARRPNRIGVSRCQLLGIDGRVIRVRGLDAIDGTPILDIKPFMVEFGPIGPIHQPLWATELMERYY